MSGKTDLNPLFHPRAVALIGASETPGKVGRIILERLLAHERPVHIVYPKAPELLGRPTVPSIDALPPEVDLAVIAIGAGAALEASEQCARHGIPFIIPVAGGFSESGEEGAKLEEKLAALPARYGTRILGPNTVGVRSSGDSDGILDTVFIRVTDRCLTKDRGVTFISQSGSVASGSLEYMANTGFSLRALVSLGNKCDLTETDFVDYFADDEKTSCLALYLEGMDGGRDFLAGLSAAAKKKPVVLLKAGRGKTGAAAVSSHTGSLAGSDQVIEGACRQYGIARAYDELELLDAAKVLAMAPVPKGNRVAVLSSAGGFGVMACDLIETERHRAELVMAELLPETTETIRAGTFPFVSPRNPVDITPSHTNAMLLLSLEALLADPGVDMVICTAFFGTPFMTPDIIPELARAARKGDKPVIMLSRTGLETDGHLTRMHECGLPGFPSLRRAVEALRFLAERARHLKNPMEARHA